MSFLLLTLLQFTALTDRARLDVLLEGNWQSCFVDGNYEELIYDQPNFSLHLGPRNEFGVFLAERDVDDHAVDNLLAGYHYDDVPMVNGRGRQWTFGVRHQQFRLNVIRAGGSREDCESYLVLLERK